MRPRLIHWERKNYHANQFDLIEFYENGEVQKRTFKKHVEDYVYYKEEHTKTFQVQGKIRLDKVTFNSEHKLLNTELGSNYEELKSFDVSDWKKAEKEIRELQDHSNSDLTLDYRLVFIVDVDSLSNDNPLPKERKEYQITFFRAITTTQYIHRLENPENLAIIFAPELNESLYFHYIPESNHITLTGDNLFALSTNVVKQKLNEYDFYETVQEMLAEVNSNIRYYHTLITKQRDRRAMLETDVMGDLYPR